ncbi:MAG: methyl-accepting chemotaxis protein [Fibrobacterota bacterium]
MLNNLSIGRRIACSFGLALFVTLAVIVLGLLGIRSADRELKTMVQQGIRTLDKVSDLQLTITKIDLSLSQIASAPTLQLRDDAQKEMDRLWEVYGALYEELQGRVDSADQPTLEGVQDAITAASPMRNRIVDHAKNGRIQEAINAYAGSVAEFKNIYPRAKGLMQQIISRSEKDYARLEHALRVIRTAEIVMGVLAVALCLLIGRGLYRAIVDPITKSLTFAQKMAQGDLTQELVVANRDEIGRLTEALNSMAQNLRNMFAEVSRNTSVLSTSSEELSAVSTQIAGNAEEMNAQSASVAASSEQAAANIQGISAAAEEMSGGVNVVATSIEEMSASLNEVARNCQKESQIASAANTQARATQERMEQLKGAAREIGKVIDVINDIADQTNLLALNASIEAASAGDAGRGFAVVANEVKALARQTGQATEEIGRQIETMQGNTAEAVKAIDEISKIIEEINVISQTIVSAVEEQSATVNEIAKTVGGASSAAGEISRNVTESAKGLSEVSGNIEGVSKAARETASGVVQINTSARQLAQLSASLQLIVNQFKV